MACAPYVHMNRPYSNFYSAQDPRFALFANTVAGSIMYYDNTLKRWTGTSSALIWNPTSNVLTGNISGNVWGTSNLIQTTRVGTGLNYLTLVPQSTTQTGGQGVLTDDDLYFDSDTFTLYSVFFAGDGRNLTGTASGFVSGSTTKINTTAGTGASPIYLLGVPIATTNPSQIAYTNASLSFVPSTGILSATGFVGSLTGSATLVATTLSSSAVAHYLGFVPLSASTPAGQAVSTSASLSYVPSTGTLTATTFSGSLTGSAKLVGTSAIAAGVRYLTFVPLATSQPNGQVLGTQSRIFYTTSTNQLSLGTTAGLTTRTPLAILDNTITDGQYNSVQLGYNNTTNNSWFLNARFNTTATDSIFSVSPYGAGATDGFYITTSGTASSFTLQARNSLELQDITSISPIKYAQVYASTSALVTAYNNSQLTIQYITGQIYGGKTFQIGDTSVGVELILSDILTAQWGVTTAGYEFRIHSDYFSPSGGGWDYLYSLNRYGRNNYKTNATPGILLDYPVLNVDDSPVIYSSGGSQTLTNSVSIAVTNVANNIWTVTVKCSGRNPFGRTVTIQRNYAFNFLLTTTGATTTHRQTPTASTQSATLNGSAFSGYTFSQTGVGTAYTYDTTALANWTIAQPVGQMTWVLTPSNTLNDEDTYVFTVDMNKSQVLPAGATDTANPAVYGGSFMTLSYTGTTLSSTRTLGSGTLTTTTTPSNTLLSVVRSGTTSGNLVLDNSIDVTATRVENTLQTTGTQFLAMLPSSATNTTNGQVVGTHNPLSYNVASSTLNAVTVSSTTLTASGTVSGATVTSTGTVNAVNIVASGDLTCVNLTNSGFQNLVYQFTQGGLGITSGATFLNCFTGGYNSYDIVFCMTTEPLAGTVLTFDLADSSGTLLATSWIGSMNFTVGALSFGYTYNNAYGIWCPHPLMTPGTCGQSTFRLTIDFPNTARAKTITGLNLGSWNGTYKHGSANTNGYNPSTTAWPSLRVNLLNNTTAGQKFTISIFGKNIY